MKVKLQKFFNSAGGVFLIGAVVGALFFGAFFGFSLINPGYTDWIFHGVTHDTAQHFIGWEFFRAGGNGAIITGLAYPVGLPVTFMDGIPLLALPLKLIADWLPTNFQYFGAWAFLCYILQGGLAAILVRKVRQKLAADGAKSRRKDLVWRTLFIIAGALIIVLSPMMIARTLYHPALAGQWLILLGILLVWDAAKFAKTWKFIAIWSVILVGAVLIHPYFLPMLGAMMMIAMLRGVKSVKCRETCVKGCETSVKQRCERKQYFTSFHGIVKYFAQILVPIALAGAVFWLIGGFYLGSGAEVRDLHEKGFNLLSFANPGGYSIIPEFPNASDKPETMMWLGLGVWVMIFMAAILWRGHYKKSFKDFKKKFLSRKARNIAIAVTAFGLLVFAIGVRVDLGPIAIFRWQPPEKIYEIWLAFRAAAREAWPFYYATILAVIYWFGRAIILSRHSNSSICHPEPPTCHPELVSGSNKKSVAKGDKKSNWIPGQARNDGGIITVAILVFVASLIQLADIWSGDKSIARHEGFVAIRNADGREFIAPEISDLVTTQKHLVVLNQGFRGDINGFSEIAQAALKHNLTINVGFFARVPESVFDEQAVWRAKVENGELLPDDFIDHLFVTTSEPLVEQIVESGYYNIEKRGKFNFIMEGEK